MKIEIYLDSLFIMNLIINLGILKLLEHKFSLGQKNIRIIIAAAMGAAVYIFLFLVPVKSALWQLAALCVSLPLMIGITLPKRKRRYFVRMLGWGLAYCFVIAGILRAVLYKWKIFTGQEITVAAVLTGVAVCVYTGIWGIKNGRSFRRKCLCEVMIESAGTQMKVKALVDTGNSLVEPISKKPVCLIEEELLAHITLENPLYLRAIPFRSVGCEQGILYGVLVPRLTIVLEGETIVASDVICAGVNHRLSSRNVYQMILHPDLVANEKSKEMMEGKECY